MIFGVRSVFKKLYLLAFRAFSVGRSGYECPICGYSGPFRNLNSDTGLRLHAECPKCGSKERHRIQYIVFDKLSQSIDLSSKVMLHFAPEPCLAGIFRRRLGGYETADLNMTNVDYNVDLCRLPFSDASFDLVYASHVLEHIKEDELALREIRRILRDDGIAILPVPIVASKTIEYPKPNPHEANHVRAPGIDYFERYRTVFDKVQVIDSAVCPDLYQCYLHEDRSRWPTKKMPLRQSMAGTKHNEFVPVCFVSNRSNAL